MRCKLFALFIVMLASFSAFSQNSPDQVKKLIFEKDSLFWVAYNNCDLPTMTTLFTDDVEFYHDKGGMSKTVDTIMAIFKRNLCSRPDFRLRRESVKGTVDVHVLTKNDIPYGALISGEHVFYISEKGKKEFVDGHASFMQLWLLDKGQWKMSRVLSYDHGAAQQNITLREIAVSSAALDKLAGKYKSSEHLIEVLNDKGKLKLIVDKNEFHVLASSETEFFMKERDLVFKFSGNKLSVIEHGQVVEEAVKLN